MFFAAMEHRWGDQLFLSTLICNDMQWLVFKPEPMDSVHPGPFQLGSFISCLARSYFGIEMLSCLSLLLSFSSTFPNYSAFLR